MQKPPRSAKPTASPTLGPGEFLSRVPSMTRSSAPSQLVSALPTAMFSSAPSASPSALSSLTPVSASSVSPSALPSASPTTAPLNTITSQSPTIHLSRRERVAREELGCISLAKALPMLQTLPCKRHHLLISFQSFVHVLRIMYH